MDTRSMALAGAILAGCATRAAGARDADSLASAAPATTAEPDPLATDPDKYSVVVENEHVRVLRYHDAPGAKTHPHHHRRFVLVTLAPFRRRLTFPDGTLKERDFQAGEAIWMPEQTHIGENVGSTDTNVLLIEVK